MLAGLPIFVIVAGVFLAAALVAWLVFVVIWFVVKRIGRATGADEKVDRYFETDGPGLTDEERIKHVGGFKHGSGGG